MKAALQVQTPSHQSTSRARSRSVFLVLGWLAACGCKRTSPPSPDERLDERHPHGAELASAAAFDLTVMREGARLAWAPKPRDALLSVVFRSDGSVDGPARELVARSDVSGDIAELALLATDGRLALGYLQGSSNQAELFAAEGAEGELLVPKALGASSAEARGERGSISLSFDPNQRDAVSLLARVGSSECVDSGRRECIGFSWWRLTRASSETRGFSLSVPAPCREHAVSTFGRSGKLAYAVCSEENGAAARRTTLFNIQTDPEYARADAVLTGCQPLGIFGDATAIWLIGECAGRRRAVRVGADNRGVEEGDIVSPRVDCNGGRARLYAGPIELDLGSPLAGLELLLPSVLSPRGSRAVWAGKALVVASAPGQKLTLSRYACEASQLKQLGLSAVPAAPSEK